MTYTFRKASGLAASFILAAATLAHPATAAAAKAPAETSTPRGLTVVKLKNAIKASWQAPAGTAGKRVAYIVSIRSANGTWKQAQCVPTRRTCIITGLSGGTTYDVRVQARSNRATSAPTSILTATPFDISSPPQNLQAGQTDNSRLVQLSWRAPKRNNGSAPNKYLLEQRAGSGPWQPATFSAPVSSGRSGTLATSAAIGPLQVGVNYQFRVAAENDAGLSSWSPTASAFIAGDLPGPVTNLTAQSRDSEILLNWNAPNLGEGTSLVSYQVDVSPSEGTVHYPTDRAATGARVSELRNGIVYTFNVTAISTAGTGSSTTVSAAALGTPQRVTGVAASPAAEGFNLAWDASAGNGSAIVDYLIEYALNPSGPWTAVNDGVSAQTSTTITALSNTTRHYFRIAAVSTGGTGTWSEPVSAVREVRQQQFTYSGQTEQYFTVPAGVTSLTLDVAGAQGGHQGVNGSRVVTTVTVTPGQVLTIQVGQKGQGVGYQCADSGPYPVTGGWPGGGDAGGQNQARGCIASPGGGGGYSGVFAGAANQANALAIAGGGGGANSEKGWLGGVPGEDGADGDAASGGAAGSQHQQGTFPATPGAALRGGSGGGAFPGDAGNGSYPGGGGGGGYYGGGGGGSGVGGSYGGKGGSGSSYSVSQASITPGHQAGNGYVTITW